MNTTRQKWMGMALLGMVACLAQADHIEPPGERTPTDWLGPQVLDPGKHGIGKRIADARLQKLSGGQASLHDLAGERGTVILVRDPQCPVSRVYGPRQAEMARLYGKKGFNFVVLYLSGQLGPAGLAGDASGFDGPAVFVKGDAQGLAGRLGLNSTGDVFVLDAQQHLRFRGAVDDQYGIGYTREFASRRLLRNALDALVDGRPVEVPATSAPGCHIDADPERMRPFQPWNPGEAVS